LKPRAECHGRGRGRRRSSRRIDDLAEESVFHHRQGAGVRRGGGTTDPDSGSNPTDDREVDVLESQPDDPTLEELEDALVGLNIDEQLDLLALTWLGRGDFASFEQARREAEDLRNKHIPSYLIGTPKLGDYIEEGLTQLGYSLEDFAVNRL
jgi:hypothetical protein